MFFLFWNIHLVFFFLIFGYCIPLVLQTEQLNLSDMAYTTQLKLDDSWNTETEQYVDELGADITQVSACHFVDDEQHEDCHVEISVGPLPDEITAEDEAFANYVDLVGFSDDEQENPIRKEKFNNKSAFIFDAENDDGSLMKVVCYEARKNCLAVITFHAINEEVMAKAAAVVEKGLRISTGE